MSARDKKRRESMPEQEVPVDKGLGERFESEIGAQSRALFEKITEHWQKLVAAAIVFVVLVTGYAGYNAYQDRRLSVSEQALNQVLLEKRGPDRLKALLLLRGEMPGPLLTRHHLETAQAAQDVGDWATALEYWKLLAAVAPENWKTVARMGQATAMLHLGEADRAVAELTSLRIGVSEEFRPLVLRQLAEAAEAGASWELALQTYEELKSLSGAQESEFFEFRMSRIRKQLDAESS